MRAQFDTQRKSLLGLIFGLTTFISCAASATTFQAENYDEAFDKTAGNTGGQFRGGDVDIEGTGDVGGGFNVGWIDQGEWLKFRNLNIPTTGSYIISLRVASPNGATASVDLNAGSIQLGSFSIPATGAWQSWTTVSRVVQLNAGTFDLGVFAQTNGWNLNWVDIVPANSSSSSIISSSSSSSVASISPTDVDKSLIVHDQATLNAADFSLRSTLQQLVNQLNAFNPQSPTTVEQFFARWWDTQNFAPGVVAGGPKCTSVQNGFSITCRTAEGDQAKNPAFFIDHYIPTALVNRFELRDTKTFKNCGEFRVIYALTDANTFGGRNFVIFEAQMPNPKPGNPAGCLPIAQFWQDLSAQPNATTRAQALRNFYYTGIPAANVGPVIDFRNYSTTSGQIRANMFLATAWNLKEFKIDIDSQGLSIIKPVSNKANPVAFLFNASNTDSRVIPFQTDFVNNMDTLLGDFNTFSLTVANDAHNNAQSFASTAASVENIYTSAFLSGTNNSFRSAVDAKLAAKGSNLTSTQVMQRAMAMTCAGCHNPSDFGLTNPNAIGPNQSWPNTLGFVHVSEFATNGVFPISPALTDVFLPNRKTDLRAYLSTNGGH